jgi:hypothetical protein
MIDKSSRYAGTGTSVAEDASGELVEALELRTIPPTRGVFFHTPRQGERLDHLATRYYRGPKRFWKICDASDELDPFDVLVPGHPVVIPPNK